MTRSPLAPANNPQCSISSRSFPLESKLGVWAQHFLGCPWWIFFICDAQDRASLSLAAELAHRWEQLWFFWGPSSSWLFCGLSFLPHCPFMYIIYTWGVHLHESARKPGDIHKTFHPCACALCCKSSAFEGCGLVQVHGCAISSSHWHSVCTKTSDLSLAH